MSRDEPRIVSFAVPVDTSDTAPAPEQLLAGEPRHVLANHYEEPTQQFFSGTWASTRGKWRVNYTEHEFCHMLAGRVVIVSDGGERSEFRTGDTFVIPAGFKGTWEVVEDCRKLYAIFQPAAAAS
jgi:uncharacterized cupin superfamily protein